MATQFEELRGLAMERALDIMRLVPDFETHGKDFMRILSTQQSVIATVLSATARVDSSKLRAAQDDGMAKVLKAVREAREQTIN